MQALSVCRLRLFVRQLLQSAEGTHTKRRRRRVSPVCKAIYKNEVSPNTKTVCENRHAVFLRAVTFLLQNVYRMQLGVAIGCVGIAMVIGNYFIYKAIRKAGKAKYGEKIIALSDELLHENEKN